MTCNNSTEISKTLNIIHINVNSIIRISRRIDLSNFLIKYNPDILLLNETKLNNMHKIKFPKYNFIRKDRPASSRGGGTGILLRDGIKFKIISNNILESFKVLETCIIRIPLASNKNIFIISVYYPSGNNDSFLKTELLQLFKILNLDHLDNYYILAGDLNSKHVDWGNNTNNSKGLLLNEWLRENDIQFRCDIFSSEYPSFPRGNSFLDVCIADNRINIKKLRNSKNCLKNLKYDSDHDALQIIAEGFSENTVFSLIRENISSHPMYKLTNWKHFQNEIQSALNNRDQIPNDRNLSNSEIDYYLNEITKIITKAIDIHVPKNKSTYDVRKYLNPTLKKLYSEKSKILSQIKKYNRLLIFLTSSELSLLKNNLKLIKKLINDNVRLSVNNYFESKLRKISTKNPDQMYNEVKKQFRKFTSSEINILKVDFCNIEILTDAGIDPSNLEKDDVTNEFIIRHDDRILDVIGNYLEKIHSKKQTIPSNPIHKEVIDCFDKFLQSKTCYENDRKTLIDFNTNIKANNLDSFTDGELFIEKNEVINIFANLKGKLSSGIDNIPNIILKKIPESLILEYCTLFNNMVNNAYFPEEWKLAKVVLIPKKDQDCNNPKNLRPISMLPNISKVFEACINNKINNFCKKLKLIDDNQFGFKYKHSTIHAIHLLTSNINRSFNNHSCTGACLIDFEKAFDTVWIQGLVYKIIKYGFPENFVFLIYNMLCNKRFIVINKDKNSSKIFDLENGLQQGTVNAPILFNIFISSLLNSIENIIGYADDVIIYQNGKNIDIINTQLQNMFNLVENFALDWNMKINYSKCETILFRPPVNKCNYNIRKNWKKFGISTRNGNIRIKNKNTVKYLGIYIDKFLYFNTHINNKIISARKSFFSYKKLFSSKHINKRVKVVLYQTLVRPIITYGCPVWFNISPSYMEKLRKFERKCLRACTGQYRSHHSNYLKYISNQKLYDFAQVSRIDNYIIKLIRNHISSATKSETNNFIKGPYYENDEYLKTCLQSGFVPPETFIFLDKSEFIQNSEGIPIFYHMYRRATDKSFNIESLSLTNNRFDTSIPHRDELFSHTVNSNLYWWLN